MKTAITSFLFLSMVFFYGCSSAESYSKAGYDFRQVDKVAVIDVLGVVSNESAKNQIADYFVMELLKKGYSPIERAQVQSLLKEQKFQASGITSDQEVAQAGRVLNVPAVIVVNIPKFNEEISLTAKMIDVQDASILWMGSGSGTTGKMLSTIAGAAVGAAAGVAVTGDDDSVIGGIAGGVLGGVAGRALSPQEAEKAREIVKKICVSLPSRM